MDITFTHRITYIRFGETHEADIMSTKPEISMDEAWDELLKQLNIKQRVMRLTAIEGSSNEYYIISSTGDGFGTFFDNYTVDVPILTRQQAEAVVLDMHIQKIENDIRSLELQTA